jgi:hypothetical protein
VIELFKIVGFLLWVNLLPPVASLVLRDRFDTPLDGGKRWRDGREIFGAHKTFRGILASILGGTLTFPLLGVPWWAASVAAGLAMAGDLLSSFLKRRLNDPSGKSIPVLDQFFEAALPTLFLSYALALNGWEVLATVVLFTAIAYPASWFWSYLLFRPSPKNYPRIIRSSVRLREWRACHPPLARWQTWLNFESFIYYRVIIAWSFKAMGLYTQGMMNTLNILVIEQAFWFPQLPPRFDGFRILLLTDLHLDGLKGLTEVVIDRIKDIDVDLCLIGGDIRMEMYGPMAPSLRQLHHLLAHVRTRHGVLGVLGNHDCIEMIPELEQAGMLMLINDSQEIRRDAESLWVIGVDDPHYYRTHDLDLAFRNVPNEAFTIFVAHSPEIYQEAAAFGAHLYLCGHTHGGQIRVPGWGPVFTHSRAPRYTAAGRWQHHGMVGYTSRGVGASGVPLRFHCPGEISLITLRKGSAPARPISPDYDRCTLGSGDYALHI